MRFSLALVGTTAVLCLAGCTTNPFLTFRDVDSVKPSTEALEHPCSEAIVVEIIDPNAFPVADFGDENTRKAIVDRQLALAKGSKVEKYYAAALQNEPARRANARAAGLVARAELADAIKHRFPNARVIVTVPSPVEVEARWRSVHSLEQIGKSARALPTIAKHASYQLDPLAPYDLDVAEEPATTGLSDIVITLVVNAGMTGEDGAFRGMSFGRYHNVRIRAYAPQLSGIFFDSNRGGPAAEQYYEKYLAVYSPPPTAEESKAAVERVAKARTWTNLPFLRMRYSDYPGDASFQALIADIDARAHRAYETGDFAEWPEPFVSSASRLKGWGADPKTSPLRSIYEWTADAVAMKLPTAGWRMARVERFKSWAKFYEADESVLSQITPEVLFAEAQPTSDAQRNLLKLWAKELEFMERYSRITAIDPVAGPLGDQVRAAAIEQNKLLDSFQRSLVFANVVGAVGVGAGAAAGGTAGMGLMNTSTEVGRSLIAATVQIDAQRSSEFSKAIADAIGPIEIELNGQMNSFLASDLSDARLQMRRLYQASRPTAGS